MPQTQSRNVGSGFTTFSYNGQPIMFMDRVSDSGQLPITAPEAVIPLGARYPVEIVTGRVLGMGTLTLAVRELWNYPVWWQLQGLAGTNSLIEIFEFLAQNPSVVTCQMVIKPPGSGTWRGYVYNNCVVISIPDDEDVFPGALTISRNITVAYTHKTALRQAAS